MAKLRLVAKRESVVSVEADREFPIFKLIVEQIKNCPIMIDRDWGHSRARAVAADGKVPNNELRGMCSLRMLRGSSSDKTFTLNLSMSPVD